MITILWDRNGKTTEIVMLAGGKDAPQTVLFACTIDLIRTRDGYPSQRFLEAFSDFLVSDYYGSLEGSFKELVDDLKKRVDEPDPVDPEDIPF
jgi:hypothetical protein